MKTKSDLQQQKQAALFAAREICDHADRGNRDFTSGERALVEGYLSRARELQAELESPEAEKARAAEGDRKLKEAILELNAGFEGVYRGNGSPGAIGGPWSRDFFKGLPYQPRTGQKDLLPVSGSVTVGQLSSTIGTLADDGRVQTILQLIRTEPAVGDAFSYLRETRRDHQASPVEVGEKKPVSVYELERIDDRIRTIAHLSEGISRNWLSDAPMLGKYIDGALREGLILELEYQILQGTATGEDLPGILNAAGVVVQAFDTDIMRTARRAITALELQPINPTAWAIHPQDWESFELLTETTGSYLLKDGTRVLPVDRAKRQLWGLPVGLTLGLNQGTAILANWPTAVTLLEREATRVDWSVAFHVPAGAYDAEDASGFERNLVKFRCEGRWGLSINRPSAICIADLEPGS